MPASRQVEDAARAHGRTTSEGAFDLNGLLLILPKAIYLVRQDTVSHQVTEQRLTGPRRWRFYKEGTTLVFPDFQRTPETHRFAITVPIVSVDVIEAIGEYANWAVFRGSDDDPAGAQQAFLAFLDSHPSTSDGDTSRTLGAAYSFGFARQAMHVDEPITHVGWIEDDVDSNDGVEVLYRDTVDGSPEPDDGGLSVLRAKKARITHLRARQALDTVREHRAAMIKILESHHGGIDAAIAGQDARCEKAVKAFLAAAHGLDGDRGHMIWSVEGKMNPGAEIEYRFCDRIHVQPDGRVVLRSDGYRPMAGRYGAGIAHPEYQPHVEISGTSEGDYYHHHGESFRGGLAGIGSLPFFVVTNPENPGDMWVLGLRAFLEDELQAIPELISRTTDWFIARLALYLDDHGR